MDNQSLHPADAQITFLVVDDDPDNLLLVNYQLLQLLDCTVISAQDGQTALSLAETHQPSLILLDIMLPEMDGFEVARCLKQNPQTQAIPIIAVTAMARSLDHDLALASGCDDYVCKPYEIETLAAAIERNLNLSFSLLIN
ncbi:response regulator [Phormidium sp. FACHB-592]|uniref:Response regulator n=1 Tax=Stenomitos frigidus AS-A4 TaxID=2933935 RepID=A0ABV0KEW1_9CYAN|nr:MULTISPECIES: response regulator [Cyanophyceae]MBD2034595.1 response regulator [Leptolyngbya sp. FACHB-321]MBD2076374.1 response regulator [Phormidium sp. FACHB-592]